MSLARASFHASKSDFAYATIWMSFDCYLIEFPYYRITLFHKSHIIATTIISITTAVFTTNKSPKQRSNEDRSYRLGTKPISAQHCFATPHPTSACNVSSIGFILAHCT
ncbi:hypothetical protein Syun_016027 [Stephania yunnanensis]|uniref:Uncharacterized protein n=1 Tax=Stephania yunnanensis TaxID=152371 RepID=A0AAP0J5V1_9MAGN